MNTQCDQNEVYMSCKKMEGTCTTPNPSSSGMMNDMDGDMDKDMDKDMGKDMDGDMDKDMDNDMDKDMGKDMDCMPGCQCKQGYVRDTMGSKMCIMQQQCPQN